MCDHRLMRRVGKLQGSLLLLLVAAAGLSVTAGSALGAVEPAAGACDITKTHSIVGQVKTNIEFVNQTAGTVEVYSLNDSGKRVHYHTLAPGGSYTQPTVASDPWLILASGGACIGYVVAPHPQYLIGRSMSSSAHQRWTASVAAAMPRWVYQMINDFNLGSSHPSGALSSSLLIYRECVAVPPNWYFVDGNSQFFISVIKGSFLPYNKLLPSWIAQISKLKASPIAARARVNLQAAQPLHAQEVNAWVHAEAAIKAHDCGAFLKDLKAAAKVGTPEWADQYAAVRAIAGLYGQSTLASHQPTYTQKIG